MPVAGDAEARCHVTCPWVRQALSAWYGTGSDDVFNDGKEMVAWRDFVADMKAADGVGF